MSIIKKIIVITDIHGKKENFALISKELSEADLIIFCGDITHFGDKEAAHEILKEIEKYNCNLVGVIGNCDYPAAEKCLIEKRCDTASEDINKFGITFIGLNGSLVTLSNTPNEHNEEYYKEELKRKLLSRKDKNEKIILISHQPPFGTINGKLPSGNYTGSHEIRNFIENIQPLICFTGHIHEGIGVDYIGKTSIVNPGAFKSGYYASIEINITNFNFDIRLKQIPQINQAGYCKKAESIQ